MDSSYKRPKRNIRNTGALSSARLFNIDSPITKQKADVQTFLSICLLSWSQYNEEEKKDILRMLPSGYSTLDCDSENKITCPISPHFVATDTVIRDQIARLKRDISDGYYTKTWQEKARKAMEDRAEGKFDEHLTRHAQDLFTDTGEDNGIIEEVSSDGEFRSRKKDRKSKNGKRGKRAVSRDTHTLELERTESMIDMMDE